MAVDVIAVEGCGTSHLIEPPTSGVYYVVQSEYSQVENRRRIRSAPLDFECFPHMRTAIVTCCTANWLPFAFVALLSCANNGRAQDSDLIILCVDPQVDDNKIFDILLYKYSICITLKSFSAEDMDDMLKITNRVEFIMKLKVDKLLSDAYDRVLYIDSDTLIMHDIRQIINFDLDGCIIGACEDIGMLSWMRKRSKYHRKKIAFDEEAPYFNAGVMLMDWQNVLKQQILPKCIEIIAHNPNIMIIDQDSLNIALRNQWKNMSHAWNYSNILDDYVSEKYLIRHFSDKRKPWSSRCRAKDVDFRQYYLDALRGTTWEGAVEAQSFLDRLKVAIKIYARRANVSRKQRLLQNLHGTDLT